MEALFDLTTLLRSGTTVNLKFLRKFLSETVPALYTVDEKKTVGFPPPPPLPYPSLPSIYMIARRRMRGEQRGAWRCQATNVGNFWGDLSFLGFCFRSLAHEGCKRCSDKTGRFNHPAEGESAAFDFLTACTCMGHPHRVPQVGEVGGKGRAYCKSRWSYAGGR